MLRLPITLLLLLAAPASEALPGDSKGPGASGGYKILGLDFGKDCEYLHWGRRGPDPRLDLFALTPSKVRIWEQGDGEFPPIAVEIDLPAEESLIDFGDVLGDEGEEIVLLNRRGVFIDDAPSPWGCRGPCPGFAFRPTRCRLPGTWPGRARRSAPA